MSVTDLIQYTKLFINNEFVDAVNKKTFPTLNPVDGKKIVEVSEADKDDIDKAVAAARTAFARNSEWRQMDASARGVLINKLADLIERDLKNLAKLEALDNGKPATAAEMEIVGFVKVLRYHSGLCDKIVGDTIPVDGPAFSFTRKEPVGVVGQIIPWNFPMVMLIWKLGPALAAGCTIVLKPAEQTPLTALAVAALTKEAGFPKGVINIVPGYGPIAGAALALHPDVNKIAFTGSTIVGKKIMEYSAQSNLKKVSLELGGKSPLVIFNDADIDEAVDIAYNAVFYNQGQTCCAGTRTFVQSGIYDSFVKKAVEKAKTRKVGDPLAKDTEQGPQIDKRSLDKILRLIKSGKDQGAKLETGGDQIGKEGYFVQPTVFSNVADDMDIAIEEIFGPVQSIFKFETLDEVIERANNTQYGLAAGIITKDLNTALILSGALEAGSVWINCYNHVTAQTPFGGYKMSGIGREMGLESINAYLETKTVTTKLPMKL